MRLGRLSAFAAALVVAACAPGRTFAPASGPVQEWRPTRHTTLPVGDAADEEFRSTPPPPLAAVRRKIAPPTETRLPNGARLVLLERHDFPSVSAVLLLGRGAADASPGVALTYAHALTGDSDEYKAGEAWQYLRFVGGRVEARATYDAVTLQTTALSPLFVSALSRSAPMFATPELGSDDVERARTTITAQRAGASDEPSVRAAERLTSLLFAGHPYGVPVDGGAAARGQDGPIEKAVRPFRDANLTASEVTVVCVGDFKSEAMPRVITKALGKLPTTAAQPRVPLATPQPSDGARVVVIDRPGAVQSNVAIGWPGPRAADDEATALEVLADATAGDLSTRLNLQVRKELGATYGVHMHVHTFRAAGYVSITAAIDTGRTADALAGLFKELERLRREPLSDEELSAAKRRAYYDLEEGTSRGLASALAQTIGLGLPTTHLMTHNARVDAVTADAIRDAAAKRLTTDGARMVVTGDAAKIADGLRGLGLGAVTVEK